MRTAGIVTLTTILPILNSKPAKMQSYAKKAEKKVVERLIRLFDWHVTKKYEAYELLTGEFESDQSRAFKFDDIKSPPRFASELSQFIRKVNAKFSEPDFQPQPDEKPS